MKRKKALVFIIFMMVILTISGCKIRENKLDEEQGKSVQDAGKEKGGLYESIEPIFPAFTLNDIEGTEISSEIFKDNDINIINIWQSTCEPCMDELGALNIIYNEYKDKGVNVIGIAVDDVSIIGDDGVRRVIEELNLDFPNVISNDRYSEILMEYVTATPTSFVVVRDGEFLISPMAGSVSKEEDVERFKVIIESIQE